MYARSSQGGTLNGVSKSGPAPSGSITVVPPEEKNSAICSCAAIATAAAPGGARPGSRVRFVFQVNDNAGNPVKGATVTFLRAHARTDARGTAKITATFPKSGRATASVAKKGLKGAKAVVRSSR